MNSKLCGISLVISLIAIVVSTALIFQFRNQDSLSKINRTKIINVCVAELPGFSHKDKNTNKYSGINIDIIEKIANSIGAKVNYHDSTFGEIIPKVKSGICDVGMSLYIMPERITQVNFTRSVAIGGEVAIVRAGDKRFNTIDDINKHGIKIVTSPGESGDVYSKANFINATIIPSDLDVLSPTKFLYKILSGQVDIGIVGYFTGIALAEKRTDIDVLFRKNPLNRSLFSYAIRYGDNNLLDFLNNSLLLMKTNGTIDKIMNKYEESVDFLKKSRQLSLLSWPPIS